MTDVKDDVPTLAWEPKRGYPAIAVGTLVIFGGRPAAGKSTSARWVCAELTKGTLPGAWYGTPVGVAWIGTEESEVYMMKPGLRAAGADLDKVVIPEVQFGPDGDAVSILHHLDMDALAEEFRRAGIRVVVLDPLMSAVGSRTDVNRSNEVRSRLEPWVKLAEAIDGFVIGIAHLKKSFTGDVVAALNGSSAFGEVARSIFGFAKDDEAGDGTRLMSHAKSSFGPEDISYTYTLEPVEVTTDSRKTAIMSRFVLGEETDRTVSDALRDAAAGAPAAKAEDKPLTEKAAMLVDILTGSNGELLELTATAATEKMAEANYSSDQTRRAREELAKRCRIGKPYRKGDKSTGPYYWKLLPFIAPDGNPDGPKTVEGLPSCHSASEQQVSAANQTLDGMDGKVGNSLGDQVANHPQLTVVDGRTSTRGWVRQELAAMRDEGHATTRSDTFYARGQALGHNLNTMKEAVSLLIKEGIISVAGTDGRSTIWALDGRPSVAIRPCGQWLVEWASANLSSGGLPQADAVAAGAAEPEEYSEAAIVRAKQLCPQIQSTGVGRGARWVWVADGEVTA